MTYYCVGCGAPRTLKSNDPNLHYACGHCLVAALRDPLTEAIDDDMLAGLHRIYDELDPNLRDEVAR